jgi:hypothetical protein
VGTAHTGTAQLVQEGQHSGNSTHRYSSWYRRGGTVGTAHIGTAVGTGGAAQWEQHTQVQQLVQEGQHSGNSTHR